MIDPAPRSAGWRHALDAGLALILLAGAIGFGYGVLRPGAPPARSPSAPVGERPGARLNAAAPEAAAPRPGRAATARNLAPGPATGKAASVTPPAPDGAAAPAARRAPPRNTAPAPPPRPPEPRRVTGRVLNAARNPIAGAAVVADGRQIFTASDGSFGLEGLPPGTPLLVKVPGYERVTVRPDGRPLEVTLTPRIVKAAYLTYYGVGDRDIRGRVLELLAQTELNAVVIDVKGDRGWIPYRTGVPLALAAGAQGPVIIRDFDALLADLKARGVYTIARIVVFKDNVLAQARPELAVIDTRTGRPWIGQEKLAWVDPFREEVWTYNIEIAREAARKGFDEIQFDYVRFPSDGRVGAARYARPNTRPGRLQAIAGFLERAHQELGLLGVFVAVDVFGYTAFNENDTDIGQRIEHLAPHVDYLSPMVYPSGYHLGIPGYRNPVAHPYQVVFESVRLIRERAAGRPARVRPWLQSFRDYAFDRRPFGPAEIRAQIQATNDAGGWGWMLWNPRNEYSPGGLRPKDALAAR